MRLAAPHLEQSAVSCWRRCPQSHLVSWKVVWVAWILMWPRTCEAVSDAHLYLSYSGLFTSHSLNRCPFKWQCPINSPVIMRSRFLLKISNSPALLAEGLLRKPLACLCLWMDRQYSSCFLLVQSLITPLATFATGVHKIHCLHFTTTNHFVWTFWRYQLLCWQLHLPCLQMCVLNLNTDRIYAGLLRVPSFNACKLLNVGRKTWSYNLPKYVQFSFLFLFFRSFTMKWPTFHVFILYY
jgi:hypothetical protein